MFGHSHSQPFKYTAIQLKCQRFVCHRTIFAITASHQHSILKMQKCIWHGLRLHTNDIRQTSAASCEMFSSYKNTFSSMLCKFLFFLFSFALFFHCFAVPGVLFMLFFPIKYIFPVLCKIYSRDKHLRKVYLSLSFSPSLNSTILERTLYIFFSFLANKLECKLFALAFLLFISFLRAKCQTTLSHTQIV